MIEWNDIVGQLGVVLIIGSYLLLQMEKIDYKSPLFSLINAIGALMVLISLTIDFNLAAFVIESFWLLISLYGLVKNTKNKNGSI